jgi:hypothetical protein
LYDDIDPDEIDLIASVLEGHEIGEEFFISFHDEDGERNLIKGNRIMLMESIRYSKEDGDDGQSE